MKFVKIFFLLPLFLSGCNDSKVMPAKPVIDNYFEDYKLESIDKWFEKVIIMLFGVFVFEFIKNRKYLN